MGHLTRRYVNALIGQLRHARARHHQERGSALTPRGAKILRDQIYKIVEEEGGLDPDFKPVS